jgi:hypothetical protein
MRSLLGRLCFTTALISALVDVSWAACPPRILTRLGTVPPVYRDRLVDYWKRVPSRSDVEKGMVAALDLSGTRGAEYVSGIIEVFIKTSEQQFERIARLKDVGHLDEQIAALGSRLEERVWGVNAELRFADERIGASNVKTFQERIPASSRPDITDSAGNLYEIKYRSWTKDTPESAIRADLADILEQSTIQQEFAASQGKMFTLAFEVPIPSKYDELFDEMFYDLMSRGNVAVVNGF